MKNIIRSAGFINSIVFWVTVVALSLCALLSSCDTSLSIGDAQTVAESGYPASASLPNPWESAANIPCAVVEISFISDERITLAENYSKSSDQVYAKVECQVLASFNTSIFSENTFSEKGYILDGASTLECVPFELISNFYFSEKSINKLSPGDIVLIHIGRMNQNGFNYYGPLINDEGFSEFLFVNQKRLQINDSDFQTRSFMSFQTLNDTLDNVWDLIKRGAEETDVTRAMPKMKIVDGMALEDFYDYMSSWSNARQIVIEKRKNTNTPY